jgi:outer membrane protein assembly factor BamE (lipoprotein component of BamABCDE complex)
MLLTLLVSGCSVKRAAQCPEPKSVDSFKLGSLRGHVIAEMGTPVYSGKDGQGNEYEVFVYSNGCDRTAKTLRAIWYGLFDIFTAGLWEIISNPLEDGIQGQGGQQKLSVTYDQNNRVAKIEKL